MRKRINEKRVKKSVNRGSEDGKREGRSGKRETKMEG